MSIAEGYVDDAQWDSEPSIKTSDASEYTMEEPTFEPILFFFYGTLKLPKVLKRVLQLQEEPILVPAEISNYKIRLWGPYPALVEYEPETDPASMITIPGAVYEIATRIHLDRLVRYEGENYAIASVPITLLGTAGEDQNSERQGKVFVWNGYPEDLRDGNFDMKVFF
ncbi:hypothetical protein ABW20_dc0104984 [Dactylellina cionopaga]|nr:hypothetical protein ABW20_dc0104984 [Dactylellina cionopaga]